MMFVALVQNETLKILRRKRFAIVIGILVAILVIVSYGQYRQLRNQKDRNWRAETQERVARYNNALRGGNMNPTRAKSLRAELNRLQFYLDHDIEPDRPTAPFFVRGFANVAGFLLLPLLISVLGSDIVSAEHAEGTDKLLLTRPVRRWKILLSKLVTLWIFATVTLLSGAVLAYCISAPFLPARGWTAPTFRGFQLAREALNMDAVRQLPLWQDTLIAYGLTWFALLCVASVALMLSVIFRSRAAALGGVLRAALARAGPPTP